MKNNLTGTRANFKVRDGQFRQLAKRLDPISKSAARLMAAQDLLDLQKLF